MGPGRTCQYLKSLYTCRCDTFIDTIIKDVFWTHKLGSIMLQFYILTGCDYISFVSGTGKATFLKIFFQHAAFINGAEYEGCLSQNQPCDVKQGYLSPRGLQTAEILGLIICFAIHFLCVTIE